MSLLPIDPKIAGRTRGRGLFGRPMNAAEMVRANEEAKFGAGASPEGMAMTATPANRHGGMMFRTGASTPPLVPTDMPANWDLSATNAAVSEGIANARKPGFFDSNGLGPKLLEGLGNFAVNLSASQGNPAALGFLQNRMAGERQSAAWAQEEARRAQDRQWQVEDRDVRMNAPDYFMSGRDRIRYDPRTGTSTTVYDGAEDFETFAQAMGFEPGTAEYRTAAQDFVLRGNGPTAYGYDVALEGERQAGRERMEGVRQSNRMALRGSPTYRDLNPRAPALRGGGGRTGRAPTLAGTMAPILGKVARGENLTPGEQRAWSMYRQPRGGGGGGGGGRGGSALPVVASPADARKLPPGTKFKTPDGRVLTR